MIIPCILVLSFEFDFVWSTRYFPVYPVSESCLDVIKDYYLSLSPRLRVPVPPSCVHSDRRSDLTVSGAHSPRFVFHFQKSFVLFLFCLFRGKEVTAHHPAIAHCKSAGSPRVLWPRAPRRAVRGRSRHRIASDSMPAGPPLTQCPPDRRWLNARRIAADSSPPDRRWLMPAGRRNP